jgi:hypothetical protein
MNILKILLLLSLLVVSNLLFSQTILNNALVKIGTKWKYKGTIYRTASTENNTDTTYDVEFDISIQKIIKVNGDTTVFIVNNFFDNVVFPPLGNKKSNRILVLTPNIIFISKFEVNIDKVDTKSIGVNPDVFNILITKNKISDNKNKSFFKEFNIHTLGVVQSLDAVKGMNKKSVTVTEYKSTNKRAEISLIFSNEIGFFGYTFDISGGKATYGSFDLISIEK